MEHPNLPKLPHQNSQETCSEEFYSILRCMVTSEKHGFRDPETENFACCNLYKAGYKVDNP